ncbi:hypothetical protein ONZ45_g7000 [Pleurotus djamor]|nr:hypothetical protein ONZ45_g7000 [Pleurotus djamor]
MAKGLPSLAHAARQPSPSPETVRPPVASFPAEYAARSRSTHSIGRGARSSRLPSLVVPYLRRPSAPEALDMSTPKTPLLTLKLTSLSFLDSRIHDDRTRHPLYSIKTTGTSTVIKRADPWGHAAQKAAIIKWPRMIPSKTKDRQSLGVLVQMKGDNWREGDIFLRQGSLTRQVSILPDSQPPWKKVGNCYWCTAPSCKGPIAVLDPHVENVPPRLRIYETLHDKYDDSGLAVHSGVSILLMDYVLVTAILLVTDIQEWMVVQKYEGEGSAESSRLPPMPHEGSASRDHLAMPQPINISQSRWRKILTGEPLFPKLNLQRSISKASTVAPGATVPATPTSVHQMAKIIHREPLYPSLRTPTPDSALSLVDYDDEDEALSSGRIPSPIASSIYFPTSDAPSHNYFDPTFYDADAPPVPPLPAKYASSISRVDNASIRSSPRCLPTPPKSATTPLPNDTQPWTTRSQSTPPGRDENSLDGTPSTTSKRPSTAGGPLPSPSPRYRSNSLSRSSFMSNGGFPRPLPELPVQTPTPPPSQSPPSRSRALLNQSPTPTSASIRSAMPKRTSALPPRSLPPTPGQSTTNLPLQAQSPLPPSLVSPQQTRVLKSVASNSSLASTVLTASDVEAAVSPRGRGMRTGRDKDAFEAVRRQRPPTIRESVFDREVPPPAYSSLDIGP